MKLEILEHPGEHFEGESLLASVDRELTDLLVSGGDARILPFDAANRNPYGCAQRPAADVLEFGSSTASTISAPAYLHVKQLQKEIQRLAAHNPGHAWYETLLEGQRQQVRAMCCPNALNSPDIVFAASGTDMHLLLTQALAASCSRRLQVIGVIASETGSGVPMALAGKHFSTRTALGTACEPNESLQKHYSVEQHLVALRQPDGHLRSASDIDAEFEQMTEHALAENRDCLIVVADCTKTGIIAPSLDMVARLKKKHAEHVHVMVDASQFRLGPSTIEAYLAHDFIVALTGSKFLGGPSFSAFALIPEKPSKKLSGVTLPQGVRDYSHAAEWPLAWRCRSALSSGDNAGLLLRLSAALFELRRFRAIPDVLVHQTVQAFQAHMATIFAKSTQLRVVDTPGIVRTKFGNEESWDRTRTIFPFLVYSSSGQLLDAQSCKKLFFQMQHPHLNSRYPLADDTHLDCLTRQIQLGQPVSCGFVKGQPAFALRICLGARNIIDAINSPQGTRQLLNDANDAMKKAEFLADWIMLNP